MNAAFANTEQPDRSAAELAIVPHANQLVPESVDTITQIGAEGRFLLHAAGRFGNKAIAWASDSSGARRRRLLCLHGGLVCEAGRGRHKNDKESVRQLGQFVVHCAVVPIFPKNRKMTGRTYFKEA